MSSEEIQLTLTPAQAAAGATVDLPLPSGSVRLRIPPARDGDLVRARVGDQEVLLRIRVRGPAATQPPPTPPPTPPPAPAGKSGALGCLLALGAVAALVIGIVVASGSDDDSHPTASASVTPSSTYSPYTPYTPSASTPTPTPADTGTGDDAPATAPSFSLPLPGPTTEAPRPFDEGTCLNGQLPDSTTATRVTGVREVSCGADDAHYRVIQRFPGTSDMSRCDQNPDTQYGFSYRYTLGSSVINEYVYCLVGLGSYARS
ncbi:hypothetical protein [Streptomyces sp. NPDC001594]|uniref:LppU/SCO3897 family protein n=1 Tax=Streptomyces sp. NPDC001594 TaxID=3364590 RepID=UPI0036865FEA